MNNNILQIQDILHQIKLNQRHWEQTILNLENFHFEDGWKQCFSVIDFESNIWPMNLCLF